MDKIYSVVHLYDVDGGYGDRISVEDTLFVCEDLEVCKKFVDKYSNKHVYDTPYQKLFCHKLVVREIAFVEDDDVLDIEPFDTENDTDYSYESDLPVEFEPKIVYELDDR